MSEPAAVRVLVHGRVQGVFFRSFASRQARELGLTGYVRNLWGGAVEVLAEGDREQLEKLIGYLKIGPPAARVDRLETTWSGYTGKYSAFAIAPSD